MQIILPKQNKVKWKGKIINSLSAFPFVKLIQFTVGPSIPNIVILDASTSLIISNIYSTRAKAFAFGESQWANATISLLGCILLSFFILTQFGSSCLTICLRCSVLQNYPFKFNALWILLPLRIFAKRSI